MLLHTYALAKDYRDRVEPAHANSAAVSDAFEFFVDHGLVTETNPKWHRQSPANRGPQYKLTDKGRAMVEAYKNVPIPVCIWVC